MYTKEQQREHRLQLVKYLRDKVYFWQYDHNTYGSRKMLYTSRCALGHAAHQNIGGINLIKYFPSYYDAESEITYCPMRTAELVFGNGTWYNIFSTYTNHTKKTVIFCLENWAEQP